MKYLFSIFFFSLVVIAGDGTPDYHIWLDLGITQKEYYYLSGFSGLLCGNIFAFVILYLLMRK